MITRGTTPYHSFVLPLKTEDISEVYITYLQNREIILDKVLSESEAIEIIDIDDEYENASMNEPLEDFVPSCELTIHLTQEDTLKFHFYPAAEKNVAVVQIRVLTTEGEAYASEPIHERIFGILKDGVIGNE